MEVVCIGVIKEDDFQESYSRETAKSNEDELLVLPDFKGKETIDFKISDDLTRDNNFR